jgi:hypothetical protein
MPPEEDARAILRLALRHEQSLAASLEPAFAQENWGFLAQQCVENLLKGLIVLAGVRLPEETPLSSSREDLLISIRELRAELERLLEGTNRPPIGNS